MVYKKKGSGKIIGGNDTSRKYPFELQLYVASDSIHSVRAIQTVERVCREHLDHQFLLEIIDLNQNPEVFEKERIVVTPTLIRALPYYEKRLIQDIDDERNVIHFLEILIK